MSNLSEKLKPVQERFTALQTQLRDPEVIQQPKLWRELTKEYEELKPKVALFEQWQNVARALTEANNIIAADTDHELIALAKDERDKLVNEQQSLEQQIQLALIPPDPLDHKNIIMEIRAGAGGDEATLFATELFQMYSRFAANQGWRVGLLSTSRTGLGGFKEVIVEITGQQVYSHLKYESGVHRVQRVPATEKSGRVHTSTVTVAVMPEAEEVDVQINPNDIRIDVFRSSGHGGQSVNTTDSAVRLTHLPTGLIVTCQDEKSQHKNKAKAFKVLQSRLLTIKLEEERKKSSTMRRSQIGTGDRSEKIRTYNFPQDRITDHRLKQSWSNIKTVLDGELEPLINTLRMADATAQLAAL